uniref:TonB C-terminal domain-containing protein n=1 Tax=Dechloromonas aromatica (strain RCB) TaxID=159087 RepID=Q47BK9_DECAR
MLLFTANYLEQSLTTSRGPLPRLSVDLKNSAEISSPDPVRSLPLPITKTDRPKASPAITKEIGNAGSAPASQERAPKFFFDPYYVDEIAFALSVPELPLPTNEETVSGSLQIKVFIDTRGVPDEIEIVQNTLPDDYVASLTNAFSKAKFQPALRGGVPVNSWRVIEITYGDKEPPQLDEGTKKESQ